MLSYRNLYLLGPLALSPACIEMLGDDCTVSKTCPPEDGETGGNAGDAGDGDGDGDENTGGRSGDGDGDNSGGRTGDGDGDGGTGSTSSGGSSPEPCDGACEDPTPLCNEGSDECVQCLVEGDCESAEGTPACDPSDGRCVECLNNSHCPDEVCAADEKECVECLEDADCGDEAFCDTATNTCEECLTDGDCTDPTMARCDTSGEAGTKACTACTDSDQCAGHEGTTVCDLEAGGCVECTGAAYTGCGTDDNGDQLVCDSLSRTCSTTETEKSSGLCGDCITDAECQVGQSCILQRFDDTDVGYFCFWQKGGDGGAPTTCSSLPPYVGTQSMAQSIDGVVADVCALRLTTCPAMNGFGSPDVDCAPSGTPDDALCGEVGLSDAYCRLYEDPDVYRCTVPCGSSDDCKEPFACDTLVSPQVCELNP